MTITRANLQRTRQELGNFVRIMNEAHALVAAPRRGSAQPMSSAELEFALRGVANSVTTLYQAFDAFLSRAEQESNRPPPPALPRQAGLADRSRPGMVI